MHIHAYALTDTYKRARAHTHTHTHTQMRNAHDHIKCRHVTIHTHRHRYETQMYAGTLLLVLYCRIIHNFSHQSSSGLSTFDENTLWMLLNNKISYCKGYGLFHPSCYAMQNTLNMHSYERSSIDKYEEDMTMVLFSMSITLMLLSNVII